MNMDWEALLEEPVPPDLPAEILRKTVGDWAAELVDEIVTLEAAADALTRFVMGPILQWEGDSVHSRLSLSNAADHGRWMEAVTKRWPDERLRGFLESVPSNCRKMVDVAGDNVVFYLDDLHEVSHQWEGPVEGPLLCASFELSSYSTDVMTRHDRFPGELLGAHAEGFTPHASRMPLEGVWGVRWRNGIPMSVLCVTETRTRKSIKRGQRYLEKLGELGPLQTFCSLVASAGLRPYLDSAELYPTGRIDLTLGILGPA